MRGSREIGMNRQLRNCEKCGGDEKSQMYACRPKHLSGQTGKPVRIQVAGEEHGLKENQAGHPNGRGSSKRRQYLFGSNWFDKKKQKCGAKNRGAVECAVGGQCVALEGAIEACETTMPLYTGATSNAFLSPTSGEQAVCRHSLER